MFANEAATKKFSRRGRILGSAACVATALIAVGVGVQPATASQDDSGAHRNLGAATAPALTPTQAPKPALAARGLGSQNLIQSGDFSQQGLVAVGATVGLTGGQALSACSGEEVMRDLTAAKAYAEVTWTFAPDTTHLTESVAEGATDKAAASSEAQLNAMVVTCQSQNEPEGHWYYSAAHSFTTANGEGQWYTSYNGDGVVAGGTAVVRSGNRVAIVEITGQPVDDPGYIRGIAAAAINELAS